MILSRNSLAGFNHFIRSDCDETWNWSFSLVYDFLVYIHQLLSFLLKFYKAQDIYMRIYVSVNIPR